MEQPGDILLGVTGTSRHCADEVHVDGTLDFVAGPLFRRGSCRLGRRHSVEIFSEPVHDAVVVLHSATPAGSAVNDPSVLRH